MDKVEQYRNIIERLLTQHVGELKQYADLRDKTVFDRQSDSYLLVREGWDKGRRVHAVITHLEIIAGKISRAGRLDRTRHRCRTGRSGRAEE